MLNISVDTSDLYLYDDHNDNIGWRLVTLDYDDDDDCC